MMSLLSLLNLGVEILGTIGLFIAAGWLLVKRGWRPALGLLIKELLLGW